METDKYNIKENNSQWLKHCIKTKQMTERSEHCQNIAMRILERCFLLPPNSFYLDKVLKKSLVEEFNLGFQF